MYIGGADMTCLRQGDIVRDIPFPLLKLDQLVLLGKSESPATSSFAPIFESTPRGNWLTAQVPVAFSHCAVLTQCCDLALNPQRKNVQTGFHSGQACTGFG